MLLDEVILNTDTFVPSDPAETIRPRAEALIQSRKWSTNQVWYGDQREPTMDIYGDDSPLEDGKEPEGDPRWSFGFNLGLEHIPSTTADWFSDVVALLEFLQQVYSETGSESIVEIRYPSVLWFSETVEIVDYADSARRADAHIRNVIEHFAEWRPAEE